MPLTSTGKKVLRKFKKEYGKKDGESAFYASINSGKLKNMEKSLKWNSNKKGFTA